MENCRSSSGDKFSFPVIIPPGQDPDQFEFDPVTTPADHLFLNGKLLPHVFPIQTPNSFSYSRSTSRTSSKDSLMSSRSNSTNSRSSCSSARTSTSEVSERSSSGGMSMRKERNNRPVLSSQYQYGSSQRWQLLAVAPVLTHQGSRSRKVNEILAKKSSGDQDPAGAKSWFGRKILKSFISTCKECHAIKT